MTKLVEAIAKSLVDNPDGVTESYGKVYLQKGYHPIKFRFYEGWGGEFFNAYWAIPGNSVMEIIPTTQFFVQ